MLVDTNTLLRTLQPHHPLCPVVDGAIQRLPRHGEELHIVPQNLVEVWAVATRPAAENGLGMTIEQAAAEPTGLNSMFNFLADTPATIRYGNRLSFSTAFPANRPMMQGL